MSDGLSAELSRTKLQLDQALAQNTSTEHTRKLALQQHAQYEQEIKSLEQQLAIVRKVSLII